MRILNLNWEMFTHEKYSPLIMHKIVSLSVSSQENSQYNISKVNIFKGWIFVMCEYFFHGEYFSGVNISQFKFRIRTDYFGLVQSIGWKLCKIFKCQLFHKGGGLDMQLHLKFNRDGRLGENSDKLVWCQGGITNYNAIIFYS